jgi:metallophosphoesterase superfamily enzyme|tara:strand:- start:193 stop:1239 length:1047 start_codon:yes stop_codon:yes gene_type:complete
MKIALLNDTHFGCRNDSPAFMEYQNRFYNELFFPYLKEHNINTLVHLGDVVDRRKFINHNTAHNFKKVFWDKIDEMKLDTHIIIGNHDTYYKNTNEINAMSNLSISKEAKVYTRPTEVTFDNLDILFLPWICDDNYDDSIYKIDNSTSLIAMGHLEVKGFEMHKGVYNDHGLDKSQFTKFEKVISGHFHKKSDDGRVYYLGTQYEITWSDYGCPKGFHIFDTETRELERISNPIKIHKKIIYNDKENNYLDFDYTDYERCFVKVFISQKTDENMYNTFIEKFYNNTNVHELQIIDDPTDLNTTVSDNILEQGEDTMTFLENYIDQIETDVDKQKLKAFAKDLYTEAGE